MTTTESDASTMLSAIHADSGVYEPQADSILLCDTAVRAGDIAGARVLDMCTGSGAVAITAAAMGAREVVAFDISPRAVHCAGRNADSVGVRIDVRLGSFDEASKVGPFDVLLCNPPYVPSEAMPKGLGLDRAWDAGFDGRVVLDPLCERASELLRPGGVLLLVQSEFSGPDRTLTMLAANGFDAEIVAAETIDFGPVMLERADWLERRGLLDEGRRNEDLVVIRGRRR